MGPTDLHFQLPGDAMPLAGVAHKPPLESQRPRKSPLPPSSFISVVSTEIHSATICRFKGSIRLPTQSNHCGFTSWMAPLDGQLGCVMGTWVRDDPLRGATKFTLGRDKEFASLGKKLHIEKTKK